MARKNGGKIEEKRIVRCKKCKKPISYHSSAGTFNTSGSIKMGKIHLMPDDLKLERSCIKSRQYCLKCYLSYIKETSECDSKACQNRNGDVCTLYPKVKSYIKKDGDIETMPIRKWADKISK